MTMQKVICESKEKRIKARSHYAVNLLQQMGAFLQGDRKFSISAALQSTATEIANCD